MGSSEPYSRLLAAIPAFATLDPAQLRALYGLCTLKVLAKGEAASVRGLTVEELSIVVSGRLTATVPQERESGQEHEAGQGDPVEARAFFTRGPAEATAVALRETVLLTLGWDDFARALCTSPAMLTAFISRMWPDQVQPCRTVPRASRLVICPAGSQTRLEPDIKEALLGALESLGEVRVLGRQSFGAGMPGALALGSPETAHWLQEQELEFDITAIITDETEIDFAKEAIGEADAILFVASSGDARLSALEKHAMEHRGARNCRLLLTKNGNGPVKNAAVWIEPRRYGHVHVINLASAESVRIVCQGLLGKGCAIAATSTGVYCAAIFGALQACEEHALPPVCIAAGGSAVLPAGLLACGLESSAIEAIFRELANPQLWKRASRTGAGLYDPAALDSFLVGALQGLEISAAARPIVAVSRSLSRGAPQVHCEGRLYGAVRAGIAPAGILPPLILDSGDILVSGENETEALHAAASGLSASPVWFLQAKPLPLGPSPVSYRSLTGASLFRLAQSPLDKRLRLETVLAAATASHGGAGNQQAFSIPIPEGIMPMDWPEWERLRDGAYEWMSKELTTRNLASDRAVPLSG